MTALENQGNERVTRECHNLPLLVDCYSLNDRPCGFGSGSTADTMMENRTDRGRDSITVTTVDVFHTDARSGMETAPLPHNQVVA